jgi:nucleotide-binding universal stress UspA family protein
MTLRLARNYHSALPNHLVAADVMTTNRKSIGRDATIHVTAEFFTTHGRYTAPVIDEASAVLPQTAAPPVGNVWHDIANRGDSGTALAGGTTRRPLHVKRVARFDAAPFRRLMVPLDGSAFAERALPLAVDITWRADAELILVHVDSALDQPVPRNYSAKGGSSYTAALKDHKHSYIERVAEKVRHECSIRVAPIVIKSRDVPKALCGVANEGVDLVVMGAYGKGLIRRWVSGGTAKELTRTLTAPLIVVGSDGSFATPIPDRVNRILIALDGSRRAEHALGPALALSEVTAAAPVLLRVVPLSSVFGPISYRSGSGELHVASGRLQLASACRYLHRVAYQLGQHSCTVDTRVVLNQQSIARTIASNAATYNADLIAIATRKDANKRWLGSIAERVVQFASAPVLIAAA